MYLFIQTLVNMNTRESMQLQTKCKSKERVVFLKHDKNMHNVLLQFKSTVFVSYNYLKIIFIITLRISAALQVNFSKISSAILLNIGSSCSFSTVQNVFSSSLPLTTLTVR